MDKKNLFSLTSLWPENPWQLTTLTLVEACKGGNKLLKFVIDLKGHTSLRSSFRQIKLNLGRVLYTVLVTILSAWPPGLIEFHSIENQVDVTPTGYVKMRVNRKGKIPSGNHCQFNVVDENTENMMCGKWNCIYIRMKIKARKRVFHLFQ